MVDKIISNSVQQTNNIKSQQNNEALMSATEAVKQYYNITSFKNVGRQIYGQLPDGKWVPVDKRGNPIEIKPKINQIEAKDLSKDLEVKKEPVKTESEIVKEKVSDNIKKQNEEKQISEEAEKIYQPGFIERTYNGIKSIVSAPIVMVRNWLAGDNQATDEPSIEEMFNSLTPEEQQMIIDTYGVSALKHKAADTIRYLYYSSQNKS